jgi:murein DD-endopeptidase MepM/ murein hydrolase activator NlpD
MLYLFHASVVFSVLYILYRLFLEKLTFHTLNRFVLIILLPISCIIPFSSNLFPSLSSEITYIPLFKQVTLERVSEQFLVIKQPLIEVSYSISSLFIIVYWFVFAIYFIKIVLNTRHLFVLRRTAEIQQKKGYQLIITDIKETFSFFNWIFIPQNSEKNTIVLRHEITHIQLKHSWDVLLTEVFIAFFWFNPLLSFYRKSLKSIHEFQADKNVLETGVKTSNYLQLLLQSLEVQKPNNIYNYFNQSILKKRVIMLTKPTSKSLSKLVYLLPLLACTLLISAFSKPIADNNTFIKQIIIPNYKKSIPSIFPVKNGTKKDITAHFAEKSKHPSVNKAVIHIGVDVRATQGTPVIATANGVVSKASLAGDWGNLIVITHSNGYTSWYAHLKGFNAKENQTVKKGDIIGYVGNTGKSTGYHLHYEVKQNGQNLNPLDYME